MKPSGGLDTAQEKEILNGKLHFWCSVSRFPVIPYNIYVFVCIASSDQKNLLNKRTKLILAIGAIGINIF